MATIFQVSVTHLNAFGEKLEIVASQWHSLNGFYNGGWHLGFVNFKEGF